MYLATDMTEGAEKEYAVKIMNLESPSAESETRIMIHKVSVLMEETVHDDS